jgi:hypothetical protein
MRSVTRLHILLPGHKVHSLDHLDDITVIHFQACVCIFAWIPAIDTGRAAFSRRLFREGLVNLGGLDVVDHETHTVLLNRKVSGVSSTHLSRID